MTTTQVATVDWPSALVALRAEVVRVTRLLRSVRNPAAAALGEWNLAEVAMHLSQAWLAVPGLANADLSPVHEAVPSLKGIAGASLIRDMWDLAGVTTLGVGSDGERDLGTLAERIEARSAGYFASCDGLSAHDPRAWLVEGVEVGLSTLTCHLLNETIVHGYDIARADGQRWRIEPAHAAMVLEGFLLPVLRALDPRTMVDQDQAAGLRATYDIRFRGGGAHHFVFEEGALTVEPPSSRRVDCHLSVDPTAMLMVAWGRRSQWPAIARGQLVAWGRRPWLGPRFRALMRNP